MSNMCACRVEAGSGPSTPIDIEEYYLNDMEGRNEIMDDDVYAQLAQKERDLNLAAELGKMLLDKNEELGRNTEIITEEYNAKLEVRTLA